MNVSTLVELYDTLEARRKALAVIASSDNQEEKDQAQASLPGLEDQIDLLTLTFHGSYTGAFVNCRDVGHVWDKTKETIGDDTVLARTLTCFRCGTVRSEGVTKNGELDHRRYAYSKGYLIPAKTGGQYGKSFWRGVTYLVTAKRL